MEHSFRHKNENTLANQLASAETRAGISLRPPHSDLNFLKTSLVQLKERYPKRYKFYYEMLKCEAQEARGHDARMGEEEARKMKNWLTALNSIDHYIFEHKLGHDRTLREKQLPIFEAIRTYFERGGSEGYVKLPTGTGKTVIFTELIEAAGLKTLIVVPREILLTQTQEKIAEFAPTLDTGLVYAGAKQYGHKVTIITYDSFVACLESGFIDPKEYDLLILDEAHRGLSDNRRQAIDKFPHALKVGFTATPEFSEKKKVENILPDCIAEMSIREAVEQGMLCSFVSGIIETNVDLSGIQVNQDGEYDEEMLEKAIDVETRNRGAVEIYKKLASGKKAVTYCVGVEHAKHVANAFQNSDIPAAAIWGEMPTADKKELFKKYKSGEIKVLCNADLLVEGFDDCEVCLCINLRPTRSPVMAEQRGGRALRLDENNLDKTAYIVDFLDRKGESGLDGAILFSEVAGLIQGRSLNESSPDSILPQIIDDDNEKGDLKEEEMDIDGSEKDKLLYERLGKIDLEGMKAVFDVREILKMIKVKEGLKQEPGSEKFLSYASFIEEARAANIKNQTEYNEIQKLHPKWPSNPPSFYKEWMSWTDITGNPSTWRKIYLSYADFISEAKAAGIKNQREMREALKTHRNWPSTPEK